MRKKLVNEDKKLRAYIIGLALGDGNLSNPNKRAVRLRISCDKKYPLLISHVAKELQKLFPENSVNLVIRRSWTDISVFSNQLPEILGWKVGSKESQNVTVPSWIKENPEFSIECIRGLLQTDGSIYKDRGYTMVNFTSQIPSLAHDFRDMVKALGFRPNTQTFIPKPGKIKYTLRISRDSLKFIQEIGLWKS